MRKQSDQIVKIPSTTRARLKIFALLPVMFGACSDANHASLNVYLGTRSVSKLPFVIAADQRLFRKYGLDVDLRMPDPAFESGKATHNSGLLGELWRRFWVKTGISDEWKEDVYVDGLTPSIVRRIDYANFPHRVAVAATDCVLRAHIVATPDINSLEDLKGRRVGISARRDTTTGFGALTLARRMGWDPVHDLSIKYGGRDLQALADGHVDAIVASEIRYATAMKAGMRALADTREWDVALAGNSAMVAPEWLKVAENREAIRRFLRALGEAIAIFHNDRELSISIMQKWHGIDDREIAEIAYERGQWIPRKPYPCYQGVENTFELYDSNEMRRYDPADFYDDSFLRELDDSGFFDSLY